MSTSYWVDQGAAGPVISLARHGATCSFKSNNVFMTPTGEYIISICVICWLGESIEHFYCQPNKTVYL